MWYYLDKHELLMIEFELCSKFDLKIRKEVDRSSLHLSYRKFRVKKAFARESLFKKVEVKRHLLHEKYQIPSFF